MNVYDYFFKDKKYFEKDFVIGSKEIISYKNLINNSLKVANYLQENIGTQNNIILINHNSVFFITVYLGILKSGNICVPLDFLIEQENLDFITDATESRTVFCGKNIKSKLVLNNFENIIDEDFYEEIISNTLFNDFKNDFESENVAEIIFTSGSTGKPKGVMISHQNIISNTNSIIEYLKITSNDIGLVVLPFYYCFGLSLLHTHLKAGGQIVLNNTFMFLNTVINDLKTYGCTSFSGAPSHYQMLLKKSKTFKETAFPSLRYVSQAGGKLHNVFIEELVDNFSEIEFFVMYGQTEATARLSYLHPDLVLKKIGSIGKAIPGVELKIFDNNDNEVKIGQVGEIVAKGGNIMKGYYKDLEGTNTTLRNGWLHTGDLAKIDGDGCFYIVAREKEIIKVGGKRVSPREIEGIVLSIPEVIDCRVYGISDDLLGESLKMSVVVNEYSSQKAVEQKILIECRKKLALFKIPRVMEFVKSIPVSKTGKRIQLNN